MPLAGLHRLLLPLSDQVAALQSRQAAAFAPMLAPMLAGQVGQGGGGGGGGGSGSG